MKKNVLTLVLAIVVMATCLSQVQAAPVAKPASRAPAVGAYAEGIYAEYATGAGDRLLFEVETLASGRLAEIAGTPFGQLITVPGHLVVASQFGTQIRDPQFVTPATKGAEHSDLEATVAGFEEVGYPIDLGRYRRLQVGVAMAGEIREHQALEFCWSSLGHCVVLDPVVVFLDSMVQNRLRLSAEGWGPRLVMRRPEEGVIQHKATCGLASNPSKTDVYYYWGAYWVEYRNIFGMTLVHKDMGAQKAGIRCNASCMPDPYGYSNASSCWGTLGWTCACDNDFGYGTGGPGGRSGKFMAETKCTHQWVLQAKASASVTGLGSIDVDIDWTVEGGVDANGGEIIDTCGWY